jgi:micrococcal nuclease
MTDPCRARHDRPRARGLLVALRVLLACLVGVSLTPATTLGQEVAAPAPPRDGELVLVVDVIDGDTIRVERANGEIAPVRYIGIDTPEVGRAADEADEPWAREASAANARLVAGEAVLLERDVSERDRFDRLLRYVWVERDGRWLMVNGRLVDDGLAYVRAYEPDLRHHRWLEQLEAGARASGLGVHGPPPDHEERDLVERILDFLFGV